jgi:hypothetical protein
MLQSFKIDTAHNINSLNDNFIIKNKYKFVTTPEYDHTESELLNLSSNMPTCTRLALEDLKSFEVLEHQFQNRGVTFSNVIIIEPSNPAFAVPEGMKVLMGAPKSGLIEMNFTSPVKFVSGLIRSSRRTILSAYNQNEQLLAQDEMLTSNLLDSNSVFPSHSKLTVNSDSVFPSLSKLTVNVENIYKVVFYAFDAQLIVVDLSFGV